MNETSQIIRVTILGTFLNVFLVGLKLSVGIVVGSAALVADAIHSISDFTSDIVVLLGVRLSSRPPDESHDYGHGKYELIAATTIAVMLVGAGFYIAWKSGLAFSRGEVNTPGYWVLVVAAVSIVSKEWIYQATQRVARRVGSSVLHINAWHHRSDALSSVAVLFGAIASQLGWGHGDQLAAIVVGVMIIIVGLNAFRKVFVELTEGSISDEERKSIVEAIQSVPEVKSWHRLRTRLLGREVFMDVHVRVDKQLSVADGHQICSTVENAIAQSLGRSINIVVHCEPEQNPTATNNGDACHD